MIRRLLYHFFWNFYDYLGTNTLIGALGAFPLMGIVIAGLYLAGKAPSVAIGVTLWFLTIVLFVVCAAALLAGTYAFSTRAARDEPARLADFRRGAHSLLVPYLKMTAVLVIISAVIIGNVAFYSRFSAGAASPAMRMALLVASMVFFWIGVGTWIFVHPALAAPAWFESERGARALLRKAFILFVLAPGFWFGTSLLLALFLALCMISVIGVLIALPITATLTSTAMEIVVRHADLLAEARKEMGEGHSLRAYRKRAIEKAWEWEYQQPRRTLRELIKPWEM